MWHDNVAATLNAIEGLVRRYNSSQSEVKVKLAYQGTDVEEMTKLVASLGGGDLPNIVQESEVFGPRLIDTGEIAPMQEFIDRDNYDLSDLNQNAVQYFTLDGKLWAMPFGMAVPLLYYNKMTFREVGLDPEKPPEDIEEVRQISEKMLTARHSRQCDANRHRPRYRPAGTWTSSLPSTATSTPTTRTDAPAAPRRSCSTGRRARPSSSGGTTWSRRTWR